MISLAKTHSPFLKRVEKESLRSIRKSSNCKAETHPTPNGKPVPASNQSQKIAWSEQFERCGIIALISILCAPMPRLAQRDGVESWYQALLKAHEHQWVFGRDIIWTSGPAGWLATPEFAPEHFWARIVADFAFALFVSSGVVLVAESLSPRRKWLLISAFLVIPVMWFHFGAPELLMLIGVLMWGLLAMDGSKPARFLLPIFLAWCLMIKVSFLLTGTATVALVCLKLRSSKPAVVFLMATMFFWAAFGQPLSPGAFARWAFYSLEMIRGYNGAMVMDVSWLVLSSSFAVGLLALTVVVLSQQHLLVKIYLVGLLFIAWKTGLVRADLTHQGSYLGFLVILVLAIRFKGVLARHSAAWAAVGSLVILTWQQPNWLDTRLQDMARVFSDNLRVLLSSNERRAAWSTINEQERSKVQLPNLARIVGTNSTVDVFSWDIAAVVFNRMNYSPRPVPQSYAAYTPALAAANSAHLDAEPPDYVLLQLGPLEGHFAPAEDSLAFLRLVTGYTGVGTESSFALLKRNPNYSGRIEKVEIESGTFSAGEAISIPRVDDGKLQWLEVECPGGLLAKLRTALFADNLLRVRVERMGQPPLDAMAPRACLAIGFLAYPLVLQTSDLLHTQSCPLTKFSFNEPGRYRRYVLKADSLTTLHESPQLSRK